MAYVGMVVFAVMPIGWFVDGIAGVSAGAGLLLDTTLAIRSAQIGETLMEENNLFYQLKDVTQGAQQVGKGFVKAMPHLTSLSAVFANNWDHSAGGSFESHFYQALVMSANDLSVPLAANSVIYGGVGALESLPGVLEKDEVALAKLRKSLGMAGGGLTTIIAGLGSVGGVYKALKNG
ncbi:hypothetical protein [Piscirickettsia salmonis]|uniref:hypothetical protein n=1 Tax=Piscirickettsia salmonis TaxID=1238 RepID=UPI00036EC43B|nr:hypothetical protein [Piscirickettsia salmonis]AMA43280.1 hypothetical protein AWJ11_13540 [Piscirickettsia salmonis]APS60454.1 hypothetical protein AVI53_07640 [Piscirickettsia salmonis]APS69929.1 hypothetical protein AVI56_06085 [Piscirickettsia salmonis]APS84086.1 hypothetical protein AVM71_13785 [Piscirickettsia salmonis]KLV35834.1 hypothetical protein AB894_06205 [Piscirickettsia salmonis]